MGAGQTVVAIAQILLGILSTLFILNNSVTAGVLSMITLYTVGFIKNKRVD